MNRTIYQIPVLATTCLFFCTCDNSEDSTKSTSVIHQCTAKDYTPKLNAIDKSIKKLSDRLSDDDGAAHREHIAKAIKEGDTALARVYLINAINSNGREFENYQRLYEVVTQGNAPGTEQLEELHSVLSHGLYHVNPRHVQSMLQMLQEVKTRQESHVPAPLAETTDYKAELEENLRAIETCTDTNTLQELAVTRLELLDQADAPNEEQEKIAHLLLAIEQIRALESIISNLESMKDSYKKNTEELCKKIQEAEGWHGILPAPVPVNAGIDDKTMRYTGRYDELKNKFQGLLSPDMKKANVSLSHLRTRAQQVKFQISCLEWAELPDQTKSEFNSKIDTINQLSEQFALMESLPIILIINQVEKETRSFINDGNQKLTPKIEILRECIFKISALGKLLPTIHPYERTENEVLAQKISHIWKDASFDVLSAPKEHYSSVNGEMQEFHQPEEILRSKIISLSKMMERHVKMRHIAYQHFAIAQLNDAYNYYNAQTPFIDEDAEQLCNYIKEIDSSLLMPDVATMFQDILSRCVKELPADEAANLQINHSMAKKKLIEEF